MSNPIEPTAEQCTTQAIMPDGTTAVWYPQMGGYVAKAVARADGDGCADVWVWHDGQFPFSGDDESRPLRSPVELHHCEGYQFVQFGRFLGILASK